MPYNYNISFSDEDFNKMIQNRKEEEDKKDIMYKKILANMNKNGHIKNSNEVIKKHLGF